MEYKVNKAGSFQYVWHGWFKPSRVELGKLRNIVCLDTFQGNSDRPGRGSQCFICWKWVGEWKIIYPNKDAVILF